MKRRKRIISLLTAAVLLFSTVPAMSVSAAEEDLGYYVKTSNTSTLANGITQDLYTVQMENDNQQNKIYMATIDLDHQDNNGNKDVHIYANYKDNIGETNKWGMQRTSDQMKAAQKRRSNPANQDVYKENFNVVAGINGSFYNMSTGQPANAFAMDGKIIQDAGNRAFFAILKDGKAVIGSGSEWETYKQQGIQEAISIGGILLKDGRNIADTNEADNRHTKEGVEYPYPYSFVGIKDDGTTVLMGAVDGLKKPQARGWTHKELAQMLIDQGCVSGAYLDGGGSTTYVSKQSNGELKMLSDPVDGYERTVSATLYVASTTPPSDDFKSVEFLEHDQYVTSGATVDLPYHAYSSAHTQVTMPEDVGWRLAEDCKNLGTVEPGKFLSKNGQDGEATIEVVYRGNVVGTTTVNVVAPDKLEFSPSNLIIPYGETVNLVVKASYQRHPVKLQPDDIKITLDDGPGTMNGMAFTAVGEEDTAVDKSGTLTAKFRGLDTPTPATATVRLGEGSKVIEDFEKAESSQFYTDLGEYSDNVKMSVEVVDKESGKVHDGSHSLKVTVDSSKLVETTIGSGIAWQVFVGSSNVKKPVTGAQNIGYWVWVPDEDDNTALSLYVNDMTDETKPKTSSKLGHNREGINYDEGHWYYLNYDLSGFANTPLKTNFWFLGLELWGQNIDSDPIMSLNNKLTFYVDSYTVDYSNVIPDRTPPVIGEVQDADTGSALVRGTPYDFGGRNTVSFKAAISDPEELKSQGIDGTSAKAYIDGEEIDAHVEDGNLVTAPVTVTPGDHTLKLYISDNNGGEKNGGGNTTNATRTFTVGGEPAVKLVPSEKHNANLENGRVPVGGIYYADVVASDIDSIRSVEMDLDLNNVSTWELQGAEVNPNFKMTYEYSTYSEKYATDENIMTVKFTRAEDADFLSYDSDVIASLPVRAWGNGISKDKAQQAWSTASGRGFYPEDITIDVDRGAFTTTGDTSDVMQTFGGSLQVDTELYDFSEKVVPAETGKTSWHIHDSDVSVTSKDPTCTEFGYTNRTLCDTCGSPKDADSWGTVEAPLGHDYKDVNGVLKCTRDGCETLFNGVWTDGITYVNGKVVADGWTDDFHYYKEGKAVTGIQLIKDDGKYYEFDENGVCKDKTPYTGFLDTTGGNYQVANLTPQAKENKLRDYTYTFDGITEDHTYKYIVGGKPNTGWFSMSSSGGIVENDSENGENDGGYGEHNEGFRFHADADGTLHLKTHAIDGRKCARTGSWYYTCGEENCGATNQSEVLFFEGHDWNDDHVCQKCGFKGIDIGEEGVISLGKYFRYTGKAILPEYTLYVRGSGLNTRYDAYGYDGGASVKNNTDIGVATLTIEGRGDYYGTYVAHFTIVPESIDDKLVATTKDHTSVELSWPKMDGADYYSVYREDADGTWSHVDDVQEPKDMTDDQLRSYTVEGLKVGDHYHFRVASRAVRGSETYYCARWAYAEGTIEHEWGEAEESKNATCTEEGYIKHKCTVEGCEYHDTLYTTVLPALGHSVPEDGWKVTKEPTTSSEGERQGVCKRCGQTVTETIEKLPPASSGGGSGGFGSGGSTDPANKQDTVTNSDGSVTTTTTNPDGSKTESTTYADGTLTEKTTEKDGTVTEKTAKPDGTTTEKVTKPDGSAVECTTTPEGITGQVNTDATGNVTSANMTIPENVKSEFVTAPVKVPAAKSSKEAAAIELRVGSADVSRVEIPVSEFGPGTVAILVHEDGTEEVVRDCTIGENGVILNVEGDVTLKIVERSQNFTDVASGNWASDAVEFVAARELFQGTGNQQFTPEGNMTRGMLVTVLYRLAYEPEAAQVDFGDIDQQAYYSDAVAWAASNGVVTGYSDHAFGPDDDITREQLATILYRYAKNRTATTGQTAALSTFVDASQISPYAVEAMSWAVSSGLINGVGNNQLAPEGDATRAQVATMLMRFCENITA